MTSINPLLSVPASARQKRIILFLVFIYSVAFAAVAPFAKVKLVPIFAFIPVCQSALVVNDLLTSAVLFGYVRASSSRRFLILASAYLFTALMTVAHTLSFPGLFSPSGLLGAGIQSTAWVYIFWHTAFPLFVIAYVVFPEKQISRAYTFASIGGVLFIAILMTIVATAGESLLPKIFDGGHYSTHQPIIFSLAWGSSVTALLTLLRKKPRVVMDTWLLVALVTWLFEIALAALLNGGRYDLGFYAGRVYGLISSVVVLFMLLLESATLHQRLASMAERMAASRERTAAQRVLDAVMTQLPVGLLVTQKDGQHMLLNESASSILSHHGHSHRWASSAATSYLNIASLDSSFSEVRDLIQRVHSGEQFSDTEIRIVDGLTKRYLTLSGKAVVDVENSVIASVIVLNDITEKKKVEETLQLTLIRLRYLVENTPLAVIEWGPTLLVYGWSERAEDFFGWEAAEVMGNHLQSLPIMYEGDRELVKEMIGKIEDPATQYVRFSLTHRTKDGDIKSFEWYTSVLHDFEGNVIAAFSLILDVTDRVRAMRQLQEADRHKDVQLATIAHELRNPLAPINHAAMVIKGNQISQEKLHWVSDLVSRQVVHMSRLLDDLLDITRISSGKIKIEMKDVDLGQILQDALEMSRPLHQRCRHVISTNLTGRAVTVVGDSMRLTQVFTNLLNNAAKYTEPGGRVELASRVYGEYVEVTVRDNGVGIEPEMLLQVFQPFVQIDRASHLSRGGLGIGLALAKGITDLHEGTISVSSEGAGKGATFTVVLPYKSFDNSGDVAANQEASSLNA